MHRSFEPAREIPGGAAAILENITDVFLLDIGLPDMDGNELACRLRDQPETAGAVLAAVTGYGQEQDKCNAINSGFDYHFVKPVNSNKLANLLKKIESETTGEATKETHW
jgi:DNA-binding response OmpR family regulator